MRGAEAPLWHCRTAGTIPRSNVDAEAEQGAVACPQAYPLRPDDARLSARRGPPNRAAGGLRSVLAPRPPARPRREPLASGRRVTARLPSGGALLVLLSATLWGLSGYMVHFLVVEGLGPVQIVYYANGIGAVLFLVGLAPWAGRYLAAPWRALPGLLALGVIGGGMSFLLFTSGIALIGVS